MRKQLLFLMFIGLLFSCSKDANKDSAKYVPTDVIVKIKGGYTTEDVFDFINGFDHEVETIHSQTYTSDLPSDSLQYVLDYLNAKSYTNKGNAWFVTGYLHYQTQEITIFPKLFGMKNTAYQQDWLQSMELLKLKEKSDNTTAGCIIHFHVPEGEEKKWVKTFEKYGFVEWAELNCYVEVQQWP